MQNSRPRGSSYKPHRRPAAGQSANVKASEPKAEALNCQPGNDDNACVVCFKNVEIYSIGDCDHPVCYECSTRMRVLCQQNECPICRHVLNKVLFTLEKLPYRELEAGNRSDFYSKKYRIGFCTADIQQKFYKLLDHPCSQCNVQPYRTFEALRNHVQREHHMYFCDLCVKNLKIFTFERRCYTQAELTIHNTKGDPDNTSHRGHPLCEYCNKRYVDRDELFRHLRRDHYFCHFCDADGCNDFYNVYADLADHFRKEHFLCEEGKCATEEFTGAFRNEIEYKAHVASVHGKTLNKQQAKQTRTLQLEITLGPRGQGISNMRSRNEEHQDYLDELPSSSSQRNHHPVTIDAGNEDEFPQLAGITPGPNVSLVRAPPPSMRNLSGTSGLARTKENFPALGGAAGGSISNVYNSSYANARAQPQPAATNFKKASNAGASTASGGSVTRANAPANGMLLHVSNRPAANSSSKKSAGTEMDFPALPMGKGKKMARNLEEDMLPGAAMPMNNVAAKHRTLVDDYVSVAHPRTYQKIQMVQKEELEAKARQEALKKSAPKLTAAEFPTLAPSSSKAATASTSKPNNGGSAGSLNWTKPVSEKKQKDLDNRKSKVAPAPVLPTQRGSSTTSLNNNKTNNANKQEQKQQPENNKKEKKPKEKKNNQENQPKVNNKQKEKNNNNTNNNNNNNNNNIDKQQQQQQQQMPNSNGSLSGPLRAPPGLAAPPIKPPPGFMSNVTVNSVAKLPNNLTFTSSLGENYSIVPSANCYIDPPDAPIRNQKLVDQLCEVLKTPEAFNEFRLLSSSFRDGTCTAQAYYEHCQSAMSDKFQSLYPELLAMLPDIGKQQELYLVHKQYVNSLPPSQSKLLPQFEVCRSCKQIVLPNDFASHQKAHELTKNFPRLDNAASNNLLNAGAKNAQRK
ncbi:E3 ubiquitin-protein ligase ZNF598 [Drosophila mojavensis]|uniref:E3 ubiquitin-protein ligase ZNF598 n=1 Tax=Drosophila mojavensis TaxID=7230 RepID=UPI00017C94D4|nr:E3 ubiquitin-protein ligase ZNF598 [Drosophila mojavensis]